MLFTVFTVFTMVTIFTYVSGGPSPGMAWKIPENPFENSPGNPRILPDFSPEWERNITRLIDFDKAWGGPLVLLDFPGFRAGCSRNRGSI